ncbi:hypothetical protein [Methanobrevibacter sp.]|uniref:hypothetical protein n=1 Tax=Methanobrevibacter sp. TaxID=66852 RepID=UPI0025FD070C|nr:hypothetical protein [Methanobrevibacter sp.]MBQ2831229.1 hypothetical protein [Methanobrevibacter sp.]
MEIIEYYKKQPRIIQILDIAFIICFAYEIILIAQTNSMNYAIGFIMLVILFINSVVRLKN